MVLFKKEIISIIYTYLKEKKFKSFYLLFLCLVQLCK